VSATPPRARTKYSRTSPSSRGSGAAPAQARRGRDDSAAWALALRVGIVAGGLLAAVLLLVAEFTTLYDVHPETLGRFCSRWSPAAVVAGRPGTTPVRILTTGFWFDTHARVAATFMGTRVGPAAAPGPVRWATLVLNFGASKLTGTSGKLN
jgi:hypothetical protein